MAESGSAWLIAPGPEHLDPLDALARVADAPGLVCLHGGPGGWIHLCWLPAQVDAPPVAFHAAGALAALTAAAQDFAPPSWERRLQPASSPGEPSWERRLQPASSPGEPGHGWSGDFAGGFFVQLDHEWPAVPLAALPAPFVVRWDPAGRCTICVADAALLPGILADLAQPAQPLAAPKLAGPLTPAWQAPGHHQRVAALQAAIAEGAIYQANLTLAFAAPLADPLRADAGLFAALVRASPAPYAALIRLPGRPAVISHSPECFLAWRGDRTVSRPIKGTRPRRPGADAATRAELLASDKERAELAMIVDLVRNDLGRTAVPGSVHVTEPARVLDLPYVHHLCADILATSTADPAARIAAAFPPGSVTGCPKRMALELIARHEAGPRGAYCGAFGWIGPGAGELAVAIRTAVIERGLLRLHAGGGITAGSDPAAEWDEVRAKLAGLAAVLGVEL